MANRPPLPSVLTVMDAVDAQHAISPEQDLDRLVRDVEAAYAAQGLERPQALIAAVAAGQLGLTPAPLPDVPFDFGWTRPPTEARWQAQKIQLRRRAQRWKRLKDVAGTVGFWGWVAGVFFNWPTPIAAHPWWWAGAFIAGCSGLERLQDQAKARLHPFNPLTKIGAKQRARWQGSPRAQAYLEACKQSEVPLLQGDAERLETLAEGDQVRQRGHHQLQGLTDSLGPR